ncbi:MAG: ATP-binding cassette domain-containing protein [Clostridia bacterium]|nr:ATP-binding cassette domain-containing protein [Deltaproteobacteria bacterium]
MITVDQLRVDIEGPRVGPLSLTVQDHEHVAIIGASGSGKSLLVECLAGVRIPTGGRVYFDGIDVTCEPAWRRGCAWVPQSHGLFPHMTVRDNLAYGLRASKRPHEATVYATVSAIAEALGLASLLTRQPMTLSGGERSRVALGRALAMKPRVLVLDEPFTALDALNRKRAWDLVHRVHARGETTIVHVTHELDQVAANNLRAIALCAVPA